MNYTEQNFEEHIEEHLVDSGYQLKEYRTALISEAVTGKIDVRDEE
ncbi:MAG: restriction endonuclease subunit S [bacterium]